MFSEENQNALSPVDSFCPLQMPQLQQKLLRQSYSTAIAFPPYTVRSPSACTISNLAGLSILSRPYPLRF